MSEPAIALVEFDSISAGIVAGDAMIKSSPVGAIYAGTVHPGRYLVLVRGDTASVEVALEVGRETGRGHIVDSVFLADVHPDVTEAIAGDRTRAPLRGESLGIVESASVAAAIDAADAGAKTADVMVSSVSLADGLGGKGYVLFSGSLAEVEAAVEAAVARVTPHGALVRSDTIAQLHDEMAENLGAQLRFLERIDPGR